MTAFHVSVARPLANLYARWALANLAEAAASSSAGPQATFAQTAEGNLKLSRSEEARVYRVIYWHETFYNLFGRNEGKNNFTFSTDEVLSLFFHKFEPWESEAVGCINVFLEHAHEPIFDPIREDIAASSPGVKNLKFVHQHADPRPELTERFEEAAQYEFKYSLQDTIALGLRTSARLLQLIDARHTYTSMPDVLSQASSGMLRELRAFLDPHDVAEARRDPIAFLGDDALPTEDGGPPVAWGRLWNGTYSNLYGENVPASLQRWGYVVWDARRWEELGALGLVAEQWQAVPGLVKRIEDMYHWSPMGD